MFPERIETHSLDRVPVTLNHVDTFEPAELFSHRRDDVREAFQHVSRALRVGQGGLRSALRA